MAEIIRDHFWACWWLVVVVATLINNAICDWAKHRNRDHD